MATTKVEVKIFDEYYPLRSDGDGIQYIKQLSAMLDERLKTVADTKHRLSRARVAVVTALQIADEYCRLHGEKVELEDALKDKEAVKQENARLIAQLEQLKAEQAQNENAVKRATEKLNNEVECLIEANARLKAELAEAKKEDSVDSGLQKKYDILSKAHAKLKKDYSEMMDILEELSK